MKKLMIVIPCRDEEAVLPQALATLPRSVAGFDVVEWLLVDDGSVDRSVELARAAGVDHILSLVSRRGLGVAFSAGIGASLDAGADVIIVFDADNQYDARDIGRLAEPILRGEAEFVIGERPMSGMSPARRLLQRLGSWVVRRCSGTTVGDATSGFRAYSRNVALLLNAFSSHTATTETIIQLGLRRIPIATVPIRVNRVARPSRLIRSVPIYVLRQGLTILRSLALYRPFETFAWPALASGLLGMAVGIRFLVYFVTGGGAGHVQSLVLAAILLIVCVVLAVGAVLGSHIGALRVLLEEAQLRLRRNDLGL